MKLWHLAVIIPPALARGVLVRHAQGISLAAHDRVPRPVGHPAGRGVSHDPEPAELLDRRHHRAAGLGNGIQKLGYLPEDTTDFIFAVICEELGLFGALLTVALYLGILYVAWQVVQAEARRLRPAAGVRHRRR